MMPSTRLTHADSAVLESNGENQAIHIKRSTRDLLGLGDHLDRLSIVSVDVQSALVR